MTPDGQALLALNCIGDELASEDGPLTCIYRSGPDDPTWSLWWSGDDRVRGLTGSDPSFVLSAEALYRSRDGGVSWVELPLELPAPDVRDEFRAFLEQAEVPDDELKAVVAFMEEGPRTVTDLTGFLGFGASTVSALARTPTGPLLLATPDGVFRSPDDGDSWELFMAPIQSGSLLRVGAIVAMDDEVHLLGQDEFTYTPILIRSVDGGGRREIVRSRPNGGWPIIRTPDGSYVSPEAFSSDQGDTWQEVPSSTRSQVASLFPCCETELITNDQLWILTATGPQILSHGADDWRSLRGLPEGWLAAGVMGPDGSLVVAIYDLVGSTLSLWRRGEGAAYR